MLASLSILYFYLMDISVLIYLCTCISWIYFSAYILIYSVLISHGYFCTNMCMHLYILDYFGAYILICFVLISHGFCTNMFMHLYILDILRCLHSCLFCTYIS